MADKPAPFADAPAPKTRTDPVDWRWVEQAPPQGQSLTTGREPSRGFDHIPGDTFRAFARIACRASARTVVRAATAAR